MMIPKLLSTTALVLASVASPVVADRPGDTSICDYYASEMYGASNVTTQLKLMESIIAYAYAGGRTVPKALKNSTGIFNVGAYEDSVVYLRPWFDGTKKTTNLNDQAVAMNWLDGGGTDPLLSFLNGTTETAEIKKDTNQYTLFTHWYVAFGRIYGCSNVEDFVEKKYKTLTPAYVHKYMDLKSPHIAYFIRQIIIASRFYGFSEADAQTLETFMNARYNTKCAPAENNQLYSICLSNEGCPLAAPKADCDVYANVKPYGLEDPTATPSASSPASTSSEASSGKKSLGGGAIGGIVVGAIAGVALLAGAIWFFLKKRGSKKAAAQRPESIAVSHTTAGFHDPSMYSPQMSQSHYDPKHQSQYGYFPSNNGHESYFSGQPHDSYMSTSPPPQGWAEVKPQELHGQEITSAPTSPMSETHPGSPHHITDMRQVAEMESPYPHAWGRATPTATPQPQEEAPAPARAPTPQTDKDGAAT